MKRYFYPLLCLALPFMAQSQAVLTAVFDADNPGGLPKGVELYILQDISDLSHLGIGSANNGGGTDGVEFTFPAMPVDSGAYIYVSNDTVMFSSFFGFSPDFVTDAMAINGDDAIELFWDSVVVDVFGEIDVDGTGQPWEYMDGWAAREPLTGPDGSTFILQNWYFSGINALDGQATNAGAPYPVPIQSYTDTTSMGGPDVTVILQNLLFTPRDVTIEVGQTVRWKNVETNVAHNVDGLVAVYPCNPTGFYSGDPSFGPWDYDVTFSLPGLYSYQCDPHLLNGMFGTVTVVDPNAPAYPQYSISMVHQEDASGVADSAGIDCALTGVVHGPNFRPQGLQFTIIDVPGNVGINVFKSGEDCYQVTEGDMITVKGTISQFNGLTEIIPGAAIEVLSSGNALMEPIVTDQPLDESMESVLVRVKNITVDSIIATGASGWNLFGTNASDVQYLVRFDADVFSDVSMYMGAVINVNGVVGQYDPQPPYLDGYQLTPGSAQDIEISTATSDLPQSSIILQPNPVSDYLYLNTDLAITRVKIYTSRGMMIYSAITDQQSLNLSSFPAGLYVIIVETTEGSWRSKFVRQ